MTERLDEHKMKYAVDTDKEAEDKLVPTALALVADEARLKQLSENIEAMAQRHSAERIVDEMVKIIERQK